MRATSSVRVWLDSVVPAPEVLADTGALLAVLSADDAWHTRCVEAFRGLRLPLVTSAAVLTELFHLVGPGDTGQDAVSSMLRNRSLRVEPIGEDDLADVEALMVKYRDRPMDFADATLVHLGNRLRVATVFSIDHDDFETFRLARGRRFRIVPARGG